MVEAVPGPLEAQEAEEAGRRPAHTRSAAPAPATVSSDLEV